MLSCPIPRLSCSTGPAVTWLAGRDVPANLWKALMRVQTPRQINSLPVRADSPRGLMSQSANHHRPTQSPQMKSGIGDLYQQGCSQWFFHVLAF